ncbi:transposable element Tcb1 transposase [Trichonephila clavipes]|nr:transposable element Tcb1 transposase [Trichonephila clavipes]
MAVTDRSVTSRTIANHIESVTHHSVSARTIRRRLQQSGLSARRPLIGLLLTLNHRRLRCQWCDERRMWVAEWNEVIFTDESRICLQHHDGLVAHTGIFQGVSGVESSSFLYHVPFDFVDVREENAVKKLINE